MNVPDELKLHKFIEQKDLKTEKDFEELKTQFNSFLKYLNNTYTEWFPKASCCYKEEHVAEQLFEREREEKDLKSWVQYELYAIIITSQNVFSRVINLSKAEGCSIDLLLKDELKLLEEISFEVIAFLDYATFVITGKYAGYGYRKRSAANSFELFRASEMFFRNEKIYENCIGDFVIRPTSIVLLRQAIEIRLKNAFGINVITYENGTILKIPGNFLLEIIKTAPEGAIKFPIKLCILRKIHEWTQYYIHGGFIPYLWEIEWAFVILNPLFSVGTDGKTFSRDGSIQIKRSYYDQVENEIKSKIGNEKIKIYRLNNPESIVTEG